MTENLSLIRADKESNYIFTATAEQWVSFLKTYGSDKDVFPRNTSSYSRSLISVGRRQRQSS